MDPIIFVFLGSLAMSAALTKLQITDRVSAYALSKISPKSSIILFTIMVLNFSTAAFLSNIASTTLLLTFSLPIIRSLDPSEPFIRALLFGLAWSGNAGGMVTTIASVQNILAIKYINESSGTSISFIEWVAFAGPTAFAILIGQYFYIRFRFPTELRYIHVEAPREYGPWTWRHTFAVVVTLVTITLWALNDSFAGFFGHVGITALLPLICLFGVKILGSDDFGHLRWSTLSLMGGGIALGEAMNCSQLLTLLSSGMAKGLEHIPLWVCVLIFLAIEGALVSVINHTSAAAILFPVLNEIGIQLGNPTVLLTLSALMIGNAQLFHISSFTTALVSGVTRHVRGEPHNLTGEPFIPGPSFFFAGWPVVLGAVIIIASLGYGLVLGLKM
jgi:phosphate transporter